MAVSDHLESRSRSMAIERSLLHQRLQPVCLLCRDSPQRKGARRFPKEARTLIGRCVWHSLPCGQAERIHVTVLAIVGPPVCNLLLKLLFCHVHLSWHQKQPSTGGRASLLFARRISCPLPASGVQTHMPSRSCNRPHRCVVLLRRSARVDCYPRAWRLHACQLSKPPC